MSKENHFKLDQATFVHVIAESPSFAKKVFDAHCESSDLDQDCEMLIKSIAENAGQDRKILAIKMLRSFSNIPFFKKYLRRRGFDIGETSQMGLADAKCEMDRVYYRVFGR